MSEFPDEQQIPAEYRTDTYHIQVIRVDVGEYIIRMKTRTQNPNSERYGSWSDWTILKEYLQLLDAMWEFSRLAIIHSSTDEYRWGAEWRRVKVEFGD
jgi:hypothetical protein